jgi:hypothetical protein
VQPGAVPIELTGGPVDGEEIRIAFFTPDGASVVVVRRAAHHRSAGETV